MKVYNHYTRSYFDYPINLDFTQCTFQIEHETDFCSFNVPWSVTTLRTGDRVYIPCGSNRSRNIYIETKLYRAKQLSYPHGIYTIPISYFITEGGYNNER